MHATHLEDLTDRIKPRAASTILLWVVVGFFLILLLWASLTTLDRTVRGTGRVIPSSQLQVVSNLEGGVIEAILVRPGEVVSEGAELIRLDPTQTGSEFGSGQASLSALAAKIARLQAEVSGGNPAYPSGSDLATTEQVRIERSLRASRQAELSSVVNSARARVDQAERAVAEAEAAYQARVAARDARRAEAELIRPLVERGIEPRLSLMQAESAAAVAASEAAAASASIARARASVSEARSSMSGFSQEWRSRAAAELAQAQAEYAARRRAMPALAERVERTAVRAPLAGRVNRVLVTTVGGTVPPGAPLVEIVPSEKSMLIEARVRPQDIGFVRLNQKAKVNFTAFDPSVYGGLDGRVVSISPDALVDPESEESFYIVRIRTSSNALRDRTGQPLPIGPGMVAEVNLLGEKRTVLQYLLTPISRLSETAFRE